MEAIDSPFFTFRDAMNSCSIGSGPWYEYISSTVLVLRGGFVYLYSTQRVLISWSACQDKAYYNCLP